MVKGKVFRAGCCFIVKAHLCASEKICVCTVNFSVEMVCVQLGIGAKVTTLVARLHPKTLISRAYANYTKTGKVEGLVVVSEGPKLIHHEEKVEPYCQHQNKSENWIGDTKRNTNRIMNLSVCPASCSLYV